MGADPRPPRPSPAERHGRDRAARDGHTHCRTTVRAKRIIPPTPGARGARPAGPPEPAPAACTGPSEPRRFRTAPPAGSAAIGEGGLYVTNPTSQSGRRGPRQVAKTDGLPDPAQGRGACAAARRPVIGARQVLWPRPGPGRRVAPGQIQGRRLRDDKAAAAPIAVGLIGGWSAASSPAS